MKKSALDYLYDKSSLSTKQDKKWYVAAADEIIDYVVGLPINNKKDVNDNINLSEGNVPTQFIQEWLQPYIPSDNGTLDVGHYALGFDNIREQSSDGTIPTWLPDVGFINQIRDRFVGEYIRQFSELQVYNRDPKAVMERNQRLKNMLKGIIEESMVKLIEGKMKEEDVENIDFEKHEKEFLDKWIDDKTIEYQHRLNLLNDMTKSDMMYIQLFLNWFSCEHAITYRDIVNNKTLRKEVVDPRQYFRVPNSNSPFIKDDVAGVRIFKMNIKDIISYFQSDLDNDDIAYIKSIYTSHKQGNGYAVPAQIIASRKIDYTPTNINDVITFSQSDEVDVAHITMQSIKPVKILTYVGSDGTIKKDIVDKDYELDEEIGDLHLEDFDTFETIEFYRIGEKHSGVYIKPKKLAVQIGSLPYNGIVGYLGTGKCNPIPRRVSGLSALYKYYTLVQQQTTAKYRAWITVPESVMKDTEEMSKEDRLKAAKKDDILYFADEDASANALQSMRSLFSQGTERFISTITQLRADIRKEALDEAGMNEQRYGDTNPSAGKAVTEYAITRATTASIGLFYTFNTMAEQDAMLDLAYSKQIFKNGYKGSYFDKSKNKAVYVEIPPEEDSPEDIGVFVKNNAVEQEKKQAMLEFAFAMGQNGEPMIALEAIDSESSTQIKRLAKDTIKQKEEMEQAFRKYEEQIKLQAEQLINERETAKQEHETKIVAFQEEMANIREAIKVDKDILLKQMELGQSNSSDTDVKLRELEERKIALKKLENDLKNYQNSFNQLRASKQKQNSK